MLVDNQILQEQEWLVYDDLSTEYEIYFNDNGTFKYKRTFFDRVPEEFDNSSNKFKVIKKGTIKNINYNGFLSNIESDSVVLSFNNGSKILKGNFIEGYRGSSPSIMLGVWNSIDGLNGTWFGEFCGY